MSNAGPFHMCHSAEAEPALTCEKHRVSDIPQQIPVIQLTNASEAMWHFINKAELTCESFFIISLFHHSFCLHAFSTASLDPSTWLKRKTHFISSLFFTLYSHCILSVALPVFFPFFLLSQHVSAFLLESVSSNPSPVPTSLPVFHLVLSQMFSCS